eukprot:105344-Pyramimonas_sp.AAC.1
MCIRDRDDPAVNVGRPLQAKALIVEDCLPAVRVMITSLQKLNIHCTVVYNGRECIDLLRVRTQKYIKKNTRQ